MSNLSDLAVWVFPNPKRVPEAAHDAIESVGWALTIPHLPMGGFDRPPSPPNVGGALTIPHLPMGGFGRSIISRCAMAQASTTAFSPKCLPLRVIFPDFVREVSLPHMAQGQLLNDLVVLFDSVVKTVQTSGRRSRE